MKKILAVVLKRGVMEVKFFSGVGRCILASTVLVGIAAVLGGHIIGILLTIPFIKPVYEFIDDLFRVVDPSIAGVEKWANMQIDGSDIRNEDNERNIVNRIIDKLKEKAIHKEDGYSTKIKKAAWFVGFGVPMGILGGIASGFMSGVFGIFIAPTVAVYAVSFAEIGIEFGNKTERIAGIALNSVREYKRKLDDKIEKVVGIVLDFAEKYKKKQGVEPETEFQEQEMAEVGGSYRSINNVNSTREGDSKDKYSVGVSDPSVNNKNSTHRYTITETDKIGKGKDVAWEM